MSFEPTENGQMLLSKVSDFVATVVRPEEEALSEIYAKNPDGLDAEGRKLPAILAARNRIFKASANAGFLSAHLPTEVGGLAISHVDVYHLREAIFRYGLGLNQYVVNMTSRGPNVMLLNVQDEVRDKYLMPVVKGDKTTCLALTEYGAGSDAQNIETVAERDGSDWLLTGKKVYIGNGPYGDFAQVMARTSDAKRSGHGLTLFAVDFDSPGIRRQMVRTMVNSGDWAEITFDKVRVPAENVIGEVDEGLPLLMTWLVGERIDMCGQCLGLADYVLGLATEYAKSRNTFGQPIASRQYVQGMLVDSETEIFAAKFGALAAAERKDTGARVRKESSMAKVLATETLLRTADRAMQIHGGHGLNKTLPIEKIFRLARSMTVYEGTSEINKLTIAKEMGLPT
ncbi:MAG: acyl-CoA dehydrogenase family protein [Pseudomonadota bacterium]